jgi:parallel beta-helix repeat protein
VLPVPIEWSQPKGAIAPAAVIRPASKIAQANRPSEAKQETKQEAKILYVDPAGKDGGNGSAQAPFRTLTRALQAAQPGMVIQLAPGTYSTASGEIFPIALKPDITVQGDRNTRGQGIVLQGGGTFYSPSRDSQNIGVLGANQATLAGVTITNPNGYSIWLESTSPNLLDNTFSKGQGSILIVGTSAPIIRNNFIEQSSGVGIEVYDTAKPLIEGNVLEKSTVAIALNQQAMPSLTGNRITQNKDGVVIRDAAQPKFSNNSVEGNDRDGVVITGESSFDVEALSGGGNFFRGNGRYDINAPQISLGKRLSAPPKAPSTPTIAVNPLSTPASRLRLGTVAPSPAALAEPPAPPDIPAPPTASTLAVLTPTALPVSTSASPAKTAPSLLRLSNPAVPKLAAVLPKSDAPKLEAPKLDRDDGVAAVAFPTPAALRGRSQPAPFSLPPVQQVAPLLAAPRPLNRVNTPPSTDLTPPSTDIAPPPIALPTVRPTPLASPLRPKLQPQAPLPSQLPAQVTLARSVVDSKPGVRSNVLLRPIPTQKVITNQVMPIDIPVPPPESGAVAPAARSGVEPVALSPVLAAAGPKSERPSKSELLPVPSPNIPVGTIGSMPSVYVSSVGGRSAAREATNTTVLAAAGVRYRVIASPNNDVQQAQLRGAFPNAFSIVYKGRPVLQLGAFGDRTKADQLVQALASQGVSASVETVD